MLRVVEDNNGSQRVMSRGLLCNCLNVKRDYSHGNPDKYTMIASLRTKLCSCVSRPPQIPRMIRIIANRGQY